MNARFITHENGSPVTITLRPHQSLEHCSGGPDDEGYHYTRTTYEFDGDYVTATHESRSQCCDGRFDSHAVRSCPVGLLRAKRYENHVWLDGHGSIIKAVEMLPEWREDERGQRDYFAEAAGY